MDLQHLCREFARDGLTVLRGAIPPDLVDRMRAGAEEIRAITRDKLGPAATRPPGGFIGGRLVDDFAGVVSDPEAFAAFDSLAAFRTFVDAALGPDYENDPDAFTILFEAEDREWVQSWHRDYRDNIPGADLDQWRERLTDLGWFVQYNAALYHDVSLWVVPGSHNRDDSPEEAAVVAKQAATPPRRGDGLSPAAYAQAAAIYLRAMPGAARVDLAPGDIAIYRDSALHLGHYVPSIRRATLHGHIDTAESRAYFVETIKAKIAR